MSDQIALFDYSGLEPAVAAEVRAAEERIRLRLKRTAEDIVAIGLDLITVKAQLPHGRFGGWLQANFEMSEDAAGRFMAVAKTFGQNPQIAEFKPSVLYALAAPSTPPEVRDAAIAKAEAGESVTSKTVKDLKAALKAAQERATEVEAELDEVSRMAADAIETEKRNAADLLKQANTAYEEAARQWREHAEKADALQKQLAEIKRAPVSPEVETEMERLAKCLKKAEEDRDYYMASLADTKDEAEELQERLNAVTGAAPDSTAPRLSPDEIAALDQAYAEKALVANVETKGALTKAVLVGLTEEVVKARGIAPERWAQVGVVVNHVLNAAEQLRAALAGDGGGKVVALKAKGAAQ